VTDLQASVWLTIITAGLLTYVTRLSFILLFGKIDMPIWLHQALRYVPPAVLTAIVFPELLLKDGSLYLAPGNDRLIAGVIAILVAWRTKNILLTILAGMVVLWVLQLF
jgi:branched-subunit amino acid transport protein